jgi:hypothetical protein
VLCVLLLAACSTPGSSGTSAAAPGTSAAATAAGSGAATAACTLLTKAEVAQATGKSITISRQANLPPVSTCTFVSLSGFAVVLSVTSTPAAGLSSDIPGLGNLVSRYHLTPVSGLGDQAYGGAGAVIVRKGDTAFALVYTGVGGGDHEQALEMMAAAVVSRL